LALAIFSATASGSSIQEKIFDDRDRSPATGDWINLDSICFTTIPHSFFEAREDCEEAIQVLGALSNNRMSFQASCAEATSSSYDCLSKYGVILRAKALVVRQ